MKKTIYITAILSVTTGLFSCKKDFLQLAPQSNVTSETFFNTPQDLETYSNSFYSQLQFGYDDLNSDNISSYSGGGETDQLVRGSITPANVGGWSDWGGLRNINYMLDHASKAQGDTAAINHYIGIAKFFRAWFYFSKVKRYSDVPWFSHAMPAGDSSLYLPAAPRAVVVDSMLNDLTYATTYIKPTEGNRTRVTQWSALALMARICLYEGTYRKYHAEIGLTNDYQRFLDKAIWASQQLMQSGKFSLTSTGNGAADFRNLFSSTTLSGNNEMIQWASYDKPLGGGNNTHVVLGWTWSLSRSLMESFLMKDGTPFTSVPGYDKKTFTEVFANRDPRLAETIAPPGFSTNGANGDPYIAKPNLGEYDQVKFYPRDPAQRQGWVLDYTSLPIFRYAEALLVYAEAKAESGTITQEDIDKTINLIRDRAQMPHLLLTKANSEIDPVMANYYPNVSGLNKGAILEIRRERRVELACEGQRFDDLQRWYAGKRLQDAQQGMYVSALGGIDVTGDGTPDIAILASPNDESPINNLPDDVKKKLSKFYLKDANGKDNNFYLTNGTSGFIAFTVDRDQPRNFIEPKYYYRPIPQTQLVLNPQLKQPYGW